MLWLGTRAPHTPLLPDPEYRNAPVPTPITEGQIERNISDKPSFVQRVVRNSRRTSAGGFDFRRYHDQIAFERQSRREMLSVDDMVGRVDRLESDADRIMRSAMSKLFRDEPDLKQLIKLRSIYELLELITDRCEDVANVIEGIVLENS